MKYHQRDIVEVSFLFPDGFTFSKPSNIERDVQRRLGSIKQKYFDEIVDKIVESIF